MEKDLTLKELTLEELWALFPVRLVEHQEIWSNWYEEERKELLRILPEGAPVRISHIGSTAVPAIRAKPTIDILVETENRKEWGMLADTVKKAGYLCMSEGAERISFNKGYTKQGFAQKVFHLHLRIAGDCDELYFRDYLKDHREVAETYEALKLGLGKQFEHNRDAYTEGKTEFVGRYTKLAKKEYAGRYEKALRAGNAHAAER